jgi:hypothetical protein
MLTEASRFLTAHSSRCRYFASRNTFPGWRIMTSNRVKYGHSAILLVAAAILSAHPRAALSQGLESRFPSSLRSHDDFSSVPDQARKTMPLTDDRVVAALPDAPMPQDQSLRPSSGPASTGTGSLRNTPEPIPDLVSGDDQVSSCV